MTTKKLSIKKRIEDLSKQIPADDNDDFKRLLREQLILYLTIDAGRDMLVTLVRSVVRDELYGNSEDIENVEPQISTATSSEIKRLIRAELYGEDPVPERV